MGHPAFRCEVCHGDPTWRLTRIGDAALTWACDDHVGAACHRLQRDHEITEVRVVHYARAVERAQIAASLARIADEHARGKRE